MPKGVYKRKKRTEEHSRNIGIALTGKKHTNPNCQCMTCKAKRGEYKGENNPMFGKHHTEEAIRKNRETHIGIHPSEETIKKIRKANEGKTFEEIYGVEQSQILKRNLREKNIGKILSEQTCKKMGVVKSGESNPNWAGGLGNLPYPLNFNEKLKELIRERDNYTCQLCGKTKIQEGRNLCVHHIDYVKENLCPENLLTLCNGCNTKVNGNRKYWIEFFRLKLKKKIEEFNNVLC